MLLHAPVKESVGSTTEVMVMTVWTSLDAVKAFASEDYERFDSHVAHYAIGVEARS